MDSLEELLLLESPGPSPPLDHQLNYLFPSQIVDSFLLVHQPQDYLPNFIFHLLSRYNSFSILVLRHHHFHSGRFFLLCVLGNLGRLQDPPLQKRRVF